jgi:hypothetical protein
MPCHRQGPERPPAGAAGRSALSHQGWSTVDIRLLEHRVGGWTTPQVCVVVQLQYVGLSTVQGLVT